MTFPPGSLSLPAAAALLQLNYRTVRGLVKRGVLRGGRTGHHRVWWVAEAAVAAYLAARVAGTLDALVTPSPQKEEAP